MFERLCPLLFHICISRSREPFRSTNTGNTAAGPTSGSWPFYGGIWHTFFLLVNREYINSKRIHSTRMQKGILVPSKRNCVECFRFWQKVSYLTRVCKQWSENRIAVTLRRSHWYVFRMLAGMSVARFNLHSTERCSIIIESIIRSNTTYLEFVDGIVISQSAFNISQKPNTSWQAGNFHYSKLDWFVEKLITLQNKI